MPKNKLKLNIMYEVRPGVGEPPNEVTKETF